MTPNELKILNMISEHLDMAFRLFGVLSDETHEAIKREIHEKQLVINDLEQIRQVVVKRTAEGGV